MSKSAQPDVRQLRAIGHKLKPVVSIGGKGLNESVLAELERALSQHELIKVKLAGGDRNAKTTISAEVCERTGASLVQRIGNVILLLRLAERPDPKLSNLLRPLQA
ncbi:MAG: YhbY family RNA-binding protein [Halioglobus sp.]|nr:YhbY family RNA-binding protein [Halioglobus sp.]